MKRKMTKKDLTKVHNLLYEEGLTKSEVAKQYGYSDTSAFKRGLKSLGYCVIGSLRPIKKSET